MESMNVALITKWRWRFFTEPNLLWNKMVRTLYYSRRKLLHEGWAFMPYSQWWTGVIQCWDVFKCGVTYTLGNGNGIRLWTDIWIGETSLRTQFLDIFDNPLNKEATGSQCWYPKGWRWRYICRGFAASRLPIRRRQLSNLKDLLQPSSPINISDTVNWWWTSNQQFTVKSLYSFLTDAGRRDPMSQFICKVSIPTKIKVFI